MIRYDPQSLTYQKTFHLVLTVFQLDGGSSKLITFANYQIIKNVPDRIDGFISKKEEFRFVVLFFRRNVERTTVVSVFSFI